MTMMRSHWLSLAFTLASGACASSTACAATCTASTVAVNFGSYDVFSTQPDDVSGDIQVTCSVSTSYTIALSTGFGTYLLRTLTGGRFLLGYNLYIDSTRLSVWGDGSSGTVTASATNTGKAFPVYGRITPRQNVTAGVYSDTITVTVAY